MFINEPNARLLINNGVNPANIDISDVRILEHKDKDGNPIKYYATNYPYGGMRANMAFWLETATKGAKKDQTRFMSQSNNPKYSTLVWNKPNNGTYNHGYSYLESLLEDGIIKITFNIIHLYKFQKYNAETGKSEYDIVSFEQACEDVQARRVASGLEPCNELDIFKMAGQLAMSAYNKSRASV